jgi:hypothetical protein
MAKTPQEISSEILKEINLIESEQDKLLSLISQNVLTLQKQRIFEDGQNTNGGTFTYKKKTIENKKKKGRFQGNKVVYKNTEVLFKSYSRSKISGGWAIGLLDINREDGSENIDVLEHLEDKYGDISNLNEKELNAVDIIIDDYLDKIIK